MVRMVEQFDGCSGEALLALSAECTILIFTGWRVFWKKMHEEARRFC